MVGNLVIFSSTSVVLLDLCVGRVIGDAGADNCGLRAQLHIRDSNRFENYVGAEMLISREVLPRIHARLPRAAHVVRRTSVVFAAETSFVRETFQR